MGRKPWSDEDKELVKEVYPELGDIALAKILNRTQGSIRDMARRLGVKRKGGSGTIGGVTPNVIDDIPVVSPLSIHIPDTLVKPILDDMPICSLVYGDVHIPFQDDAALSIMYQVCEIVDFTEVMNIGDLTDNWQISSYIPPDERQLDRTQQSLQEQFTMAAQHVGKMEYLNPNADLYFLEGNHEERWSRMFRKAQEDYKWRHILSLPHVQEALSVRYMIGFSERWKYREYNDELVHHDRIVFTHGDRTTIWVTRGMLERYGKSSMFGHTHRIQNFTKTDLVGTIAAWNIGCMCDLHPHYKYSNATNWAQGFAVVYWSDDRKWFHVEQIRIHDGKAMTPWGLLTA